jgi:hypothetical protein
MGSSTNCNEEDEDSVDKEQEIVTRAYKKTVMGGEQSREGATEPSKVGETRGRELLNEGESAGKTSCPVSLTLLTGRREDEDNVSSLQMGQAGWLSEGDLSQGFRLPPQ